ncbi:hypothetical protein [Psychrobacillus antarcticus]|uniref:hypothetical protein n=1 Tax=Psychrobacillus antarcticus TaxID=2879115 RepID=UPI002408823E|nr:hypothetical protein [Psychrobacillus antarcticus]
MHIGDSYLVEDTNKEVIKKFLELQFTGPDEAFMELLWNPKYTTVVNNKEVDEELEKYVTEAYGPYFIDSYLSPFLNTYGMSYQVIADKSVYKFSFKRR